MDIGKGGKKKEGCDNAMCVMYQHVSCGRLAFISLVYVRKVRRKIWEGMRRICLMETMSGRRKNGICLNEENHIYVEKEENYVYIGRKRKKEKEACICICMSVSNRRCGQEKEENCGRKRSRRVKKEKLYEKERKHRYEKKRV